MRGIVDRRHGCSPAPAAALCMPRRYAHPSRLASAKSPVRCRRGTPSVGGHDEFRRSGGAQMRWFVAGAAGAIGMRLVPQLLARGHQVTATTRSEDKARRLRALGASAVTLDGLDAAAVAGAVARAEPDAIVHQMTALAG